MSFILILITAVGLSMDAFSLALIYGTLGLSKKVMRNTFTIVGIFHFLMPVLGYYLGRKILHFIQIDPEMIAGVIFVVLAIQMLLSIKKQEKVKILTSLTSIILFAFTVSIDSFSIGISMGALNQPLFMSALVFSIISALFTYYGIKMGNKLESKFGSFPTLIGGIILLILGICHLV